MADKYSTIQQHQPLRTPAGWDKQEKALIVQLDEIFDDIYRRFGRLRLEDMGSAFRKQLEDDEGNIADLIVEYGQIVIDVGNKYDKVSGITINSSGIDISGSKYVKIESGCSIKIESGGVLDVNTNNFKIDSSTKTLQTGNWKLYDGGLYYTDTTEEYGIEIDGSQYRIELARKINNAWRRRYMTISMNSDASEMYLSASGLPSGGKFYFVGELTGNADTATRAYGMKMQTASGTQLDFNNLTSAGVYAVQMSYSSNGPANCGASWLYVEVFENSSGNAPLFQRATDRENGVIYLRQYSSSFGWQPWKKITSTSVL